MEVNQQTTLTVRPKLLKRSCCLNCPQTIHIQLLSYAVQLIVSKLLMGNQTMLGVLNTESIQLYSAPCELHMKPLTVQFSGFSERVRKMHHTRGVKRPAGMGGPHCDHSPSSLICSHYPYQRLKIKNKDRESDGGQREAAGEREWGKWVKEGGTKRRLDVCVCVRLSQWLPFAPVWWI